MCVGRRSFLLAAALAAALSGCGARPEAAVTALGSSSMEQVMGVLAEGFALEYAGVSVSVEGGGSGAGIEAALRGTADLGLSSRALTEEEKAQGLTETLLALDGVAVIVNAANPVDDLTLDQLGRLFRGEAGSWAEVGGLDGPVACVGREAGSGTRDGFESAAGVRDACVLAQELTSTGAVVEAVRSNRQAIGYASLNAAQGQAGIKLVTVDGAACTEESVLDGSYPIRRPLVLATRTDAVPSAAAQVFYSWATSPEAAPFIRLGGAVPVSGRPEGAAGGEEGT